jgi:hypothetical protein
LSGADVFPSKPRKTIRAMVKREDCAAIFEFLERRHFTLRYKAVSKLRVKAV